MVAKMEALVGCDAEAAQEYRLWSAALRSPTRLRLLEILCNEPGVHNVDELAQKLGLEQPSASHHLRKLSAAGLVQCGKALPGCGLHHYYVPNFDVLEEAMRCLQVRLCLGKETSWQRR